MKKFLKLVFTYSLILFSLLFLFEIVTANVIVSNSDFKISSNPKYLIIGHSHAAQTYNDSLIDNLTNLAESGEAYFYTYHKIKEVISKNHSISTVFVEFSNNNIDKKMDNWTWGETDMSYRFQKFASLIDVKDKLFLLTKSPIVYLKSLVVISKERVEKIWSGQLVFDKILGGYNNSVTDDKGIDNDKVIEIENIPEDLNNYEISKVSISYLHKIIDFLDENDINVILIRSPQRADYAFWSNEQEFKRILKQEFGSSEFIDFSKFPLNNDEFLDAAHLNFKGAERFSIWFDEMLKSGMLNPGNRSDLNKAINQTNN